jgi:hypothetical protein
MIRQKLAVVLCPDLVGSSAAYDLLIDGYAVCERTNNPYSEAICATAS